MFYRYIMENNNKFLYFAYGSNLYSKRIHINNPSAERVGIGKLKHHRLDFLTYSKRWQGASATYVTKENCDLWGAIWKIDLKDMEALDRQEGVYADIYHVQQIDIETSDGEFLNCRIYQQTKAPPFVVETLKDLPDERKPSKIYLDIIKKGARESGIPEQYIDFLNTIPHNNNDYDVDLYLDLHQV